MSSPIVIDLTKNGDCAFGFSKSINFKIGLRIFKNHLVVDVKSSFSKIYPPIGHFKV